MSEKEKFPNIIITPPGPKSREWHAKASEYMKGYSSQVKQFPVVFESGAGNTPIKAMFIQSMSLSSLGNTSFGPRFISSHLSATPNCYRCPFKQKYPECTLLCMDILEVNH